MSRWRWTGPQQTWFVQFAFADGAVLAGGDDCIGIYRSESGEPPWDKAVSDFCAWAMAVSPVDDRVVLAGDPYGRGVLRSEDGGRSWERVGKNFPVSGPGSGDRLASVWDLAVSPGDGRTVYAAVGTHNPHGGPSSGGGLWVSPDLGQSWDLLALGGEDLACVWVSASSEGVVVVGKGGRMPKGEGGLLRSVDGGVSFEAVGFEGMGVVNVAADVAVAGRLYAAVVGVGCVISEDEGATWRAAADGAGAALTWGIRQDPSRPERLYQIVLGGTSACWRSDDRGESWAPTAFGDRTAIGLGVGPDGAVFVGTYDQGFWRSDDGGESWRSVESGLSHSYVYSNVTLDPSDGARVLAPVHMGGRGPAGVYESADGGASWAPTEGPRPSVVANVYQVVFDPADASGRRAWAAYWDPTAPGNGVWGSTDGGRTWSVAGVEESGCVSVFVDPRVPGVVWAGGTDGLWRSGDGGASWARAGLDGLYVTSLAAAPSSPGVLLAATGGTNWGANRDTGFWRSDDGGETWAQLPVCQGRGGYCVAFGADGDGVLYLAAQGGLWLTRDGGQTASLLLDRPDDRGACVVVDQADGALYYAGNSYVALEPGVVLRSGDGGIGWEDLSDGLPGREVWWLTVDPGRRLYASTFGAGLGILDL